MAEERAEPGEVAAVGVDGSRRPPGPEQRQEPLDLEIPPAAPGREPAAAS